MSGSYSESTRAQTDPSQRWNNVTVIGTIAGIVIISLACIAGCTVTAYAFMLNAPWQ